MKWHEWIQEEINKAKKKRNLMEVITHHNLFTKAFLDEHTDFVHIQELYITAKDLGYLKEEITKEGLDEYFGSDNNNGVCISWDNMLNEAIDQYVRDKEYK